MRAIALGWPVLSSYGMTEFCSQIATAELSHIGSERPRLKILPHVEARLNAEGFLALRSAALFTGELIFDSTDSTFFIPMKPAAWYQTQDRVEIDEGYLTPLGRDQDFLKIGGESVSLVSLDATLRQVMLERKFFGDAALLAMNDERLGQVVHLVVANADSFAATPFDNTAAKSLQAEFNRRVLPYEKAREVHFVSKFPQTGIGKINQSVLRSLVLEQK
jgi:o-succinylbenzoate---CoA ligase